MREVVMSSLSEAVTMSKSSRWEAASGPKQRIAKQTKKLPSITTNGISAQIDVPSFPQNAENAVDTIMFQNQQRLLMTSSRGTMFHQSFVSPVNAIFSRLRAK